MKWIEWERCWFLQVYDWFWFIVTCPGTKGSISHRRIPRAYSNTFTLNWAPFDHSGTLWPCLLFWNVRSTKISLSLETHFWIRNAIYLHSAPKFSIPSKFFPFFINKFWIMCRFWHIWNFNILIGRRVKIVN